MGFERGWPFSLRDQVHDLRSEVSQHGLLRGYPRWLWGQGSRIDDIAESCSADRRAETRAQHGSIWNLKLFRRLHHRLPSTALAGPVVFIAYVWFYLRFFIITTYLTVFLAVAPLAAIYAVAAILSLSLSDALLAGGYTVLAYSVVQWLRSDELGIYRLADRFSESGF
jgi:hypothetical protein